MDTWTKQNRVKRFVSAFMFSIILIAEVLSVFASGTIVSLAEDETWKEAIRERLDELTEQSYATLIDVSDLNLDVSKIQELTIYINELYQTNGCYYWIENFSIITLESVIKTLWVEVKPIYNVTDNRIDKEQAKKDYEIMQQRIANGEWKEILKERLDSTQNVDVTCNKRILISDLKLKVDKKEELTDYLNELRLINGNYYWLEHISVISAEGSDVLTNLYISVKPSYNNYYNGIDKEQAKEDFEILQQRLANGEWKEIIRERVDKLDKIYNCSYINIEDLDISESKEEELLTYFNELRGTNKDYYWMSQFYVRKENSVLTKACVCLKTIYMNSDNSINRVQARKDFEVLQRRIANGEWKEIICERIEECNIYKSNESLSYYYIYLNEFNGMVSEEQIQSFIQELLYEIPSYFYIKDVEYDIDNFSLEILIDNKYVNADSTINREKAIRDYFAKKERLSSLFIQFDNNMDDIDKVLAIYDWVMRETEYDHMNYINNTIPSISYKAEGVYEKNLAVCSGYADTIEELLNIAGIENYSIVSRTINHAWNMVKLGEYYYHIDATWDDYGKDDVYEGVMHHRNFLKDDEEIKDIGHCCWFGGFKCTNKNSYDSYIFRKYSFNTFSYYNEFWYYVVGDEIIKSKIDESERSVFKSFDESIVNMYIYKGSMYIATDTKVYKIDMENQSTMTLILDASESNIGRYIDEFVIKGDQMKIDGDEGTKLISLKPTSTIELDKTSLQLTEGECLILKATATSDYSSKVQWASSNPLVISVDEYGNIEAKGAGEAIIFASVDGVIAECKVVADKAYIYGDANGDGSISGKDVVLMKKYLAGYENLSIDLSACDVNADGDVSGKDVVKTMKYIAGYDVILGEK